MAKNSGGSIINYRVGVGIESIGTDRISKMASQTSLAPDKLRGIIDKLGNYYDDGQGLANAFRVEYQAYKEFIDGIVSGKYKAQDMFNIGNDDKHAVIVKLLMTINSRNAFRPEQTKKLFGESYRSYIQASNDNTSVPNGHWIKDAASPSSSGLGGQLKYYLGSNSVGKLFYAMLVGSFSGIYDRRITTDLYLTRARLMLALKAYHTDHKALPPTLDDLVPQYIDKVPIDPYDKKPIKYSAQKRIFYSVGKDAVDSGGLGPEFLKGSHRRKTEFPNEPTFEIDLH